MRGDLVDRSVLEVDDQRLGARRFEVRCVRGIADEARYRVPALREQSFENEGDLAVPAGDDNAHRSTLAERADPA
jgi:hypothetical protein